jgi:hypothetical protein
MEQLLYILGAKDMGWKLRYRYAMGVLSNRNGSSRYMEHLVLANSLINL